jgi:hypothetical protein
MDLRHTKRGDGKRNAFTTTGVSSFACTSSFYAASVQCAREFSAYKEPLFVVIDFASLWSLGTSHIKLENLRVYG